jgi:hypothetical protein
MKIVNCRIKGILGRNYSARSLLKFGYSNIDWARQRSGFDSVNGYQ